MKTHEKLGKILVVEDSSSVMELIKSVLEEEGYEVYCASNGEAAIEAVTAHFPNLILMDIIMPGINGYETCASIKEIENAREIPIIFMSVLDETFNKVKAFESGAVDYVMKPIDTLELLSRVHTHLTMQKLVDELKQSKMNLELRVQQRTEQLSNANDQLKKEISVRRKAQDSLKQAHDLLEKKVADRTAELKAAKDKAEAASLAKGAFLANMSHEIRTPINGIIGFTYLLGNSKISKRQQEQIKYIELSCQHLLTVINDILDLSKIEAGELELAETLLDLSSIARTVIKTLTPNSREKKLALNFNIDHRVPQNLMGDPTRIRQILFNLIYNAIKFTGAGEVSLACNLQGRTDDSATIQFSVTDTGIGLTKEKFDRIFKRFAQADINTGVRHGGTGLGLSISKQLVELMGGQIWVDSTPGQGSQFNFTIKLAINPMTEHTSPTHDLRFDTVSNIAESLPAGHNRSENMEKRNDEAFATMGHKSLSILLVEDNDINLTMAANILEKMGQHVTTADNGARALELVKQKSFDIVFMDVQMPVMDGIEATKRIREWESDKDRQIPIIAMTAHAMQGDCEKFLKSGMSDYLSKPFDPKTLKEKIERWYNIFHPTN